jgi:hypothetical protein
MELTTGLTTEERNQLALAAQSDLKDGLGRTDNVWNLIAEFTPLINDLEFKHGNNFNNGIKFVEICEKKIEYAAKAFNPNIQDFEGLVLKTVHQALKDFYKKRSGYKSRNDSYEYMVSDSDEEGVSPTYIATNENIERDVISREFIAEVIDEHGKDPKRQYIITRWSEEGSSIKKIDIAREMVDIFGGTEETHRIFVNRFYQRLREELA